MFLSYNDNVRFGLWLYRYISAVLIFIIGLKALGISKTRNQLSIRADIEVTVYFNHFNFLEFLFHIL